jgi:hypothetical protein
MVVKIEFVPNRDGITTTMLVNKNIIDEEIPFVPLKLIDSRGIALWKLCNEMNIKFETDIEFINETWDEKRELKRLFDYMLNPIYVQSYMQQVVQPKIIKRFNFA